MGFKKSWASDIAQLVKVPAVKPDDTSSSHGTHVMKGENYSCKLSRNLHTQTVACIHTNMICTHTKSK